MTLQELKTEFQKHLVGLPWQPDIWWDEDYCEIVFEWIDEKTNRHAFVSLDGVDDHYGYTYKVNGQFIAGKVFDPHVTVFPVDLKDYLNV